MHSTDHASFRYAQQHRATMKKTHRRKKLQGQATRARVQLFIGEAYSDTGKILPVRRHCKALGGLAVLSR